MGAIDSSLDVGAVITSRIDELQKEVEKAHLFISEAEIRIRELRRLLEFLAEKSTEAKKKRIKNNIKGNMLKDLLPDERDAKKVNIFLEFMERCGDEPVYGHARKKMAKLETYIYKKQSKLWNNWREFREDFTKWVNREGSWAGVLPK